MRPSQLFTPLSIKCLSLRNRVVLPPMCQYAAKDDGLVNDYHLAHYGARALGGLGLIIIEATAVEPDGRISNADLGIWSDEHILGLKSLTSIMEQNNCLAGIQLGHAGRKAWKGVGKRLAPSSIPFSQDYDIPEEATLEDIRAVVESFTEAAVRAARAGFKVIELHGAHGYLLHEFLSPISNRRTDEYGGPLGNRLRLMLEVVASCKAALPEEVVLTVRLSGSEFSDEGYSITDIAEASVLLYHAGVDAIHVSAGGNLAIRPEVWPGYQLSYAKAIKEAVPIPVIGVGLINTPELAEFALREGYCDLVAIGRPFLHDPHWAIKAANMLGAELPVPENMLKGLKR